MASNNQGNQGNQGSSNRGFASMDPDKQREIASEGGKAAHERGTAHEFNSQEAAEAGRKGGQASHGGGRGGQQGQHDAGGGQGSSNRGFASMDPDKQRDIASKGGQASHGGGHQGGGSGKR